MGKSPEESGLLIKDFSKTVENEAAEQKDGFISMLLGPLGATSLENVPAGKRVKRGCEGTIRAGKDF